MKKSNILGIIAGIIIIILAVVMYTKPINITYAGSETFEVYGTQTTPETESDVSYGGDAYATGIQNAGAQAANNLVAVYEIIYENNEGIKIISENMSESMYQDYMNTRQTTNMIKTGFSAIIFSIGLITLAKSICFKAKSPANAPKATTIIATEPVFTTDNKETNYSADNTDDQYS